MTDAANVAVPASTPPGAAAEAITDDVACPMCEYNLRGLTESRCPECGYRFDLREMLDARTRPHPYLFEHHPKHNVRSFFRTAWGGLRPWRFWRELQPAMPSKPRRLFAYALLLVAFAFTAWLAFAAPAAIETATAARACRAALLAPGGLPVWYSSGRRMSPQATLAYVDARFPAPDTHAFVQWFFELRPDVGMLRDLLVLTFAWPLLTFLTLMIFRISMRRARIRTVHVVRCVVYSFDAILWPSLLAIVAIPTLAWATGKTVFSQAFTLPPSSLPGLGSNGTALLLSQMEGEFPYLHAVFATLLIFAAFRLASAFRRYLRFDRPGLTILSSQVIVALTVFCAVTFLLRTPIAIYWRASLFNVYY